MLNNKPESLALAAHQSDIAQHTLCDLFDCDAQRFEGLHVEIDGLLYDYSKHHVNDKSIALLCDLARAAGLDEARAGMFHGKPLNVSENRAVLHTALRGSVDSSLEIDGENVCTFVENTKEQMREISDTLRADAKITDIVNIGIGGSDLGPRISYEALLPICDGPKAHFIANVDGHRISELLSQLNPENTAFIVASKTFTTQETLLNAEVAKAWLVERIGADKVAKHFYAVSTNIEGAMAFGVTRENILPMRDWVGGRFSVWGSIGLPLCVAVGFERFEEFLRGAHAMDIHFRDAPFEQNIPVLMALLGVWYHNFWHMPAHCIIPYAQGLTNFPRYLQQIDMESNGKTISRRGKPVPYQTAPITFGEPGTNAQHAFFQLFHQGTQIVPVDFITIINPAHDLPEHHSKLLSNALAQSQALMAGDAKPNDLHHHFEGNRPSATFMLDRLDPYHLGMLLAMYEHKVFAQGILWDINSFDQWGVELGKKLADNIEDSFKEKQPLKSADASTQNLMRHILKKSV